MKIFKNVNVYEDGKARIRRLFNEFENVAICFSGGKDSTATLFLAIEVARELNRLPIPVMFVDQEAEWKATIDYMNIIMRMPEVIPYWFQCQFRIFNAASNDDKWLNCWDPKAKDKWIHHHVDISIKDNIFTKDRFSQTFGQALKYVFNDEPCAFLAGVRCQESPARTVGLTNQATYKDITWGKREDLENNQYTFYPLYDWAIKDVWKFIYDNNLPYNKHYDTMYQYGIPIGKMRVSNLHHETALASLYILQEIEHDTWNKVCTRLGGIHAAGALGEDEFQVKTLPVMFNSWKEYRDFLMPKLIHDEIDRKIFLKAFKKASLKFGNTNLEIAADKCLVQCILANDVYLTKYDNFVVGNKTHALKDAKRNLKKIANTGKRL